METQIKPVKSPDLFNTLLKSRGIIAGQNSTSDIRIKHKGVFERILTKGTLGMGESYMDGWWESDHLDDVAYKLCLGEPDLSFKDKLAMGWASFSAQVFNKQNRSGALKVRRHYNTGNELFRHMLDARMVYSCAYWKEANNLDEAQEAKLDLVCRKAQLRPGMKVLDIGCGWGSFAQYAAQNYGVSVEGITISAEQLALGQERCKNLPVNLKLMDYRDLPNTHAYNAVVSIGMMEHVGFKNYNTYFKLIRQNLKPGGLAVVQTIGGNFSTSRIDPWIQKYIFPNAMLPSIGQFSKACEGLFVIEDWHNFGIHYDKTLMAWWRNFDDNWNRISKKYGERFYRMWKFYLLTCAGTFRARKNQLWQVVLSPGGVKGGYEPVR